MRRTLLIFGLAALAAWMASDPRGTIAQEGAGVVEKAYREGVLRKVAEIVEAKYVLEDKAKGFADAFRAKCAAGAYDAIADPAAFAGKVTADLVAITGDKHLNFRVVVASDAGERASGTLHHPVRYYRLRLKENTGFQRLEWLEPGIGYLELRRFYSFDQAKPMALAAMTFLAEARAIIIDVRENGGGSGDYLSSFFLPHPTQLSGSYARASGTLTEIWTRGDTGLAPRLDVPVFILIGPNTFSAAELFAYDMQSRKRATLIGEPTKGGAHSVDVFPVADRFEFIISTERCVSPVTGGNWEGTGVIPDIRVPAAEALEAALGEARKAAEAYGRPKDADLSAALDAMQALADGAARLFREGRGAEAAAALETLASRVRAAGLATEFFWMVFAYNFQAPEDERMYLAVLEKTAEMFPDSPYACEVLAAVHESRGRKGLALGAYRRVLERDPGNPNAVKRIRELSR
jgi:retinol-binding protein 3